MIEGQNGLTWPRWKKIVDEVESLGFAGLFRSDHFTNANPPDKDSLELWVSLTYLADHTERIHFGPLVCPLTFRHPAMIARQAAALDDLSGGRMVLGVGAGWQEREHRLFGFDLEANPVRFARLEEGLQVTTELLASDGPVEFKGRFYRIEEVTLLPRPQRHGGPPVLVGGSGPRRIPELAGRFASWWNGVFLTPELFKERVATVDAFASKSGRDPAEIKKTLMTGLFFGIDTERLSQQLDPLRARPDLAGRSDSDMVSLLRERGVVAGTPAQVREQLGALEDAGCQEVMLQWLELDNIEGLRDLAQAVL